MEHTVVTPDNRLGGRNRAGASSRSILYLDKSEDLSVSSRMGNIEDAVHSNPHSNHYSPSSSSSDPLQTNKLSNMCYEPPLTPLSYTTITTVADVAAAAMASAAASTNPRHSLRVPGSSGAAPAPAPAPATRSMSSNNGGNGRAATNPPPSQQQTSAASTEARNANPPLPKRGSWITNARVRGPNADSTQISFNMAVDAPLPTCSPIDLEVLSADEGGRQYGQHRPISIVIDAAESEQPAEDSATTAGTVEWATPPPASRRATHSFNNNNNHNPHSYTTSKYDKYNQQQQQQQQQQQFDHAQFAAGSMMSLAGGEGPDAWTSLLIKDQRNSISQRNQAYASMAVVAALIAGISITFLVEVNFDFTAESKRQTALLQVVVMGSMVVAFLALYATMVLSSQYYLVTKALGGVTSIYVEDEGDALATVNDFMKKTRTIRHLAVMAVVFTVPLFAVLIATYGIAKTGLDGIGYASVALGAFALLVFIHAIVSQQRAFSQPTRGPVGLDGVRVGDGGPAGDGFGGLAFSSSSIMETKEIKKKAGGVAVEEEPSKREDAKKMMQKFDNAVSTFKLFG